MAHPGYTPPGGGNSKQAAISAFALCCGFAAAFLWAPVLFEWTVAAFRRIAAKNYGYQWVDALETAYFLALHPAVFFTARLAVEITATAVIGGVAYRLAF